MAKKSNEGASARSQHPPCSESATKEDVEHWYRTTSSCTSKPLVRPDEQEAVDNDLFVARSLAELLGWSDEDVIAYAEDQLRVRRRDATIAGAAVRKVRSESGRRGGKKGAAITNADHKELHSRYQGRIDELVTPEMSYEAASKIAAREFGVSPGTIKRHTENPAPRNSGRHRR